MPKLKPSSLLPWVVAIALALVAVTLAVVESFLARPPSPPALPRGDYGRPVLQATLSGIDLTEISGLCPSRVHPGDLWVHQDSNDAARIYRFGADGAHRQTVTLSGVNAVDFEDIALGPLPDGSPFGLFVGDMGNNLRTRDRWTLIVVDERDTLQGDTVTPVRVVEVLWPGEPVDCEALMVSPVSGDVCVVSKPIRAGPAQMFRVPFDAWAQPGETPVVAERIGAFDLRRLGAEIGLPEALSVTGGDFHPRMETLALRTPNLIYLFPLGGEPSEALFRAEPVAFLPTPDEPQGEAVCFELDGDDLLTASEGSLRIMRHPRIGPLSTGLMLR